MIILALNCGSSSLKYQLYNWDTHNLLTKGNIERIGVGGPTNHTEAIELMLDGFILNGILKSFSDIKAVGHRVVHGGDQFHCSVLITQDILDTIKNVANMAPLHNPPNILGIEAAQQALPGVPQVAIFDTAFHQTMPPVAYLYPVPYNWFSDFDVRRYGFHGTSHLYVTKRAAIMLNKAPNNVNIITLHIGNGVSFTAVKDGCSIDTSMGLTPLEGAMMGTRCGDIDPAIIPFMMKKLNKTAEDIENILNKKSGHFGITEGMTDRRDILDACLSGDERAKLSLDMEAYRIKKYIGAYLAINPQTEALVFTAGVGENNWYIREESLKGLDHLGIQLDSEKNRASSSKTGETEIHSALSRIKILIIPTNEEIVLIEDVIAILQQTYQDHLHYHYSFA